MNKLTSLFLRISVSSLLIIILLYIMRDKYPEILKAIRGINISVFSLGLLAFFFAIATASLRLKMIVGAQDETGVTFLEALSLTFIGYFFNNFLPTSIGGDIVKAYYLSKKRTERLNSYTVVFIDRAIGLFTMVLMAFVALFFIQSRIVDEAVRQMIYLIMLVSLAGLLFLMNKDLAKKFSVLLIFARPIEEKLKDIYNSIHNYKRHKGLIFQTLVISVISQILFFVSIGILALSIGSRIPPVDILLRMPIISFTSLLPSINGLGLREGSTVILFAPLIGKENAFVVGILWLLVLFIISIMGWLVYTLSPQFKVNLKELE